MKKHHILLIALTILLAGGVYYYFHHQKPPPTRVVPTVKHQKTNEQPPTGRVLYGCYEKKSITADYKEGTSPSSINGSVHLRLSDGREMVLPRTKSNNGVRYANADQSLVYWVKGDHVFILENNTNINYANCVRIPDSPAGVAFPLVYSSSDGDFSLRLPAGYVTDEEYKYQAFGPGKDIDGVKFTIPVTLVKGTNLSEDSYVSIEKIPNVQNCLADRFLSDAANIQTVNENGTTYSVASSTGAAAGNRYEETVYVIAGTNPCIAVRYMIHYGITENYPGMVREFNRAALLMQFDEIRHILFVAQ